MPGKVGAGLNTLIPAEDLLPHLWGQYGIPANRCELVRRGFNDTYLVRVEADRYILRVYLNGKYYISGPDEFRFELDWLKYLQSAGLTVAAPVSTAGGALLCGLPTERGVRWSALFRFAPGEVLKEPELRQAEELGQMIGRLHRVSGGFSSKHPRYQLDTTVLIDRPVELITALARERGFGGVEHFRSRAAALREQLLALPAVPSCWGLIHGDLNRGNYHYHPEHGFTIFDFDHGGCSWRAYDLAAIRNSMDEETWQAFVAGYRSEFQLDEAQAAAVPLMQCVRRVWDIGDVLGMMPAWDTQPDEELWKTVEELLVSL